MRILIVDDHPMYRDGLAALVQQLFEGARIQLSADAEDALARLAQEDAFDLVLLDLKLPGLGGRSVLAVLRDRHPGVPVMVVSTEDDADTIDACIAAGASGFMPKTARRETLAAALSIVIEGGIYLPPGLERTGAPPTTGAAAAGRPDIPITARELQVLQGVCAGDSNKTIARQLGISEATVRAHLGAVFRALEVTNRTQAALQASRLGLFPETGHHRGDAG